MDKLHHLSEQHLLIFLAQFLLLLGMARGLGYVFRRLGQPALVGEILAGVFLGPTVFGRIAPALRAMVFPADPVQHTMIDTVSWIGLFLLLLSAGLEVDVSVAWRQRGDALKISITDIVLPMAIAFVPALLLPDRYLPDPSRRLLFAVFIATVMTISALPMTLRALHDLDLLKTDLGLLAMSALTINDIIGWVVFTLVLGVATQARLDLPHVTLVVVVTLAFAAACLVWGRRWSARAVARLQAGPDSDAGLVLTFVCCVGLVSGAFTQWLGIHALFGFFVAGMMIGGAPALSERTRHVIGQMVYAVFVPVFFATVAVQIDFLRHFDPLLVVLLTGVGVGGRYFGAWAGARMTSLSRWDRVSIAIAHTPGGSMEMVMGLVALQSGLITVPVFVAIVFAALASSITLGPWLSWSVRRRGPVRLTDVIVRPATRLDVSARTRWDMIRSLCDGLAAQRGMPDADLLDQAVRAREELSGTAVGDEIALPHARIPGLRNPAVVLGRSATGLDWDAPDGLPVHLVFLVVTPDDRQEHQLQIIAAISRALSDPATRARLMAAPDEGQAWAALEEASASVA
jgi:Kef-type K+ transport system membrane component KefB/mannitol/fructose-specific phosphotransferase system IIA component